MCVWLCSTVSRNSGARARCPWVPWHSCVWGWGNLVCLPTCATKPFFAGIGLKSEVSTLLKGGRPLMVLLALSATFIVLQNMLGLGVANIFGLDPRAGLLVGSVSLVGGIGTTLAWVPDFV